MFRIRQSGLVLFLLLVFMPLSVFADQLILMSGKTVEGKVLEQKDDYVIIEVKGINIMYRRFEIKDVVIGGSETKQDKSGDIPIIPELPVGEVPQSPGQDVKSVDDPQTKEALIKFSALMGEIGKDCEAPRENADSNELFSKASQCICKHLPEAVKANQMKVAAFLDLMKRRPELVNQTVHIEGVQGNWVLNPEDANKNTIEEISRTYNCK
ncbi:MAG: hypothetical protein NTU54_03825 [Candidatus Omnitrophica bacterium]|nr:hypothetical protein [Candidatus Omnitrophota bacterium]